MKEREHRKKDERKGEVERESLKGRSARVEIDTAEAR